MILTENMDLLKQSFPGAWEYVAKRENLIQEAPVHILPARNGTDTIAVERNNKQFYLHSQYDPVSEAEKLIDNLGDVSGYKHVFFYGVGLGYHLEAFFERYKDFIFTIFEPDTAVFINYLNNKKLHSLPLKSLQNIYLEHSNVDVYIADFMSKLKDQVLVVVPPLYERAYKVECEEFYEKFKKAVSTAKSSMETTKGYEKLWIINSIKNLPKVLDSASVMKKRDVFYKKPAIIVAAGPSLQDEFENLRYIKDNKLAYIFAIGSSNKALISQGIIPDALTTYDPNPINRAVFEEIIDQKIDNIPLIFGSSVGYQTITEYPGPMLHMITTQDLISAYFLNGEQLLANQEVVTDAPSIAVLTLEILSRFQAEPIILVGQNFAFRENQYYSQGVNYNYRSIELTDLERAELVEVESVDGGTVRTIPAHNSSRFQMEYHTAKLAGRLKVINTTRGGAKIANTEYMQLQDVINSYLRGPIVVDNWYSSELQDYDRTYLLQKLDKMDNAKKEFSSCVSNCVKRIIKLESFMNKRERLRLENTFPKLDHATQELLKNEYFNVFIKPMVRVHFDIVARATKTIVMEPDSVKRAKLIIDAIGPFIYECQRMQAFNEPLYQELVAALAPYLPEKDTVDKG